MWLLIIVQMVGGSPVVETIPVDTHKECFEVHRWVKGQSLRAQKPVSLSCVQVPKETYTEEQL